MFIAHIIGLVQTNYFKTLDVHRHSIWYAYLHWTYHLSYKKVSGRHKLVFLHWIHIKSHVYFADYWYSANKLLIHLAYIDNQSDMLRYTDLIIYHIKCLFACHKLLVQHWIHLNSLVSCAGYWISAKKLLQYIRLT